MIDNITWLIPDIFFLDEENWACMMIVELSGRDEISVRPDQRAGTGLAGPHPKNFI